MIQIQDLHKKFGKNQVLSGVDLDIDKGGVFAVLGLRAGNDLDAWSAIREQAPVEHWTETRDFLKKIFSD